MRKESRGDSAVPATHCRSHACCVMLSSGFYCSIWIALESLECHGSGTVATQSNASIVSLFTSENTTACAPWLRTGVGRLPASARQTSRMTPAPRLKREAPPQRMLRRPPAENDSFRSGVALLLARHLLRSGNLRELGRPSASSPS